MSQLIRQAVAPLKAIAEAEAIALAKRTIAQVVASFEAQGWDLNKAAPIPNTGIGKKAYMVAMAKRTLHQCIAERKPIASWRMTEVDTFVRSESRELGYIGQAASNSWVTFDDFADKLSAKIGEVETAELEVLGGVWGHSVLTVTKQGIVERWKTQMIVNVSSLGKVFNQYPTRRLK